MILFDTMCFGEIRSVPAERVGQGEVGGFSIDWQIHGIVVAATGWAILSICFFAHVDLENSPLTSHKASISGTVDHIFSAKVLLVNSTD